MKGLIATASGLFWAGLTLISLAQDNPCGVEGVVVEASSFMYTPSALEIEAGQTVVWVNVDGFHDVNGVTSTIGDVWNNPETFSTSAVSGNAEGVCLGSHTFTIEGTYDYDCSIGSHAANGMVATITVNPAQVSNTVVDVIVNSEDHTLLEAAVGAAGLVDALSGEGPFTVFAPTDEAFFALTEALEITMEELLAIPQLVDILAHHVVAGVTYSTDLSDGQEIETLFGENVTVTINYEGVFINQAQVVVADIAADNGVVHVIDAVLVPNGTGPPTPLPFTEDFANGFAGNNGVGSWTVEDTGGGLIWQAVDEAGDGYFADGTASGVHPPAGEYSTNISTLNSTTAANGWIIYDNDYWNTPISEGYSDNEGWLTSPVLNLSEAASVIVSWEQYFRYCCHPDAPIYLQVTNDGGESWVTFDGHGDFIESTNTASENGFLTTVDVSCVAAGESNVQIRFSYLQAPETGAGYSHYYWGIDDVAIYENIASNDIEAVLLTNGDIDNTFEYMVTPMEQVVSQVDGGVLAGLRYKNNGVSDQSATVLIEVLDSNGIVVSETSESLGVVSAPANSVICPDPSFESVYISTGWVPEGPGTFTLRATLSSDSGEDYTPENNVISKTMVFTDYEMGHDDEEALDTELTPQDSDIEGLYNPCGYGSFFQMQNSGSVAYGVAVRFGPNSGGGDLDFETRLYTVDGEVGLTDSPFATTYWQYDDAWTPSDVETSEYVYLPFEDPIELTTEDFYFLGVINEFESEAQLTVLGNADSDTDGSTGDYSISGAGDFIWFTSQSATPAIRLVLSPEPFTYPGCTDAAACNFDPGANIDDGSCGYTNCGCMDAQACNYDPAVEFDDGSCCECIDDSLPPLLLGAWQFDTSAGALSVGPTPLSGEWYSSPEGGLEPTQLDDRWTFTESNVLIYDNSGTTLNPFEGYVETEVEWDSWVFEMESAGDILGFNGFTVLSETPGICGWMGVWDSGPNYEIVELTETTLVILSQLQSIDCVPLEGYFTLRFVRSEPYEANYCVAGCTDLAACNFNPQATIENNEFCTYPGCDDPSAANYDALAGCTGECVYLAYDCSSVGDDAWSNEAMGLFPEWQEAMHGVPWEGEWVFNVPATIIEPGSGVSYGVHHVEWLGMGGMPDWATATSFNAGEVMGASTQHCIAAFGTPTLPGMHAITATGEVFISIFGQPFSIGEQSFSATLEVMANPNPIPGCMYPLATNFLSFATTDDGSCLFFGCTDPEAGNFNPFANVDDGSCGEGCDLGESGTCTTDVNGDGQVNVSDLLDLLGEFGAVCD